MLIFDTFVRLLFLTRENGWLLDNEHKTDWAGMGLSDPNYDDRDSDLFLSNTKSAATSTAASTESTTFLLSPAGRPDPPSGDLTVDVSSPAAPSGALATLSQSIRRLGDNLFPSPFSNPKSASNPSNAAKSVPSKFIMSTSSSGMGGGGVDKKKLDRQYIHCYGLAAVRLAAHGFVWLLNSATRVSYRDI
jgi:hypothetical protein